MGIYAPHFREYFVKPALRFMDIESKRDENFLLGVCAAETHLANWVRQHPSGPARGPYQQEPISYDEIRDFAAEKHPHLYALICSTWNYRSWWPNLDELCTNFKLATIVCRLYFKRFKEPFPNDPHDIDGFAQYWKKYYNTEKGAGTIEHFKSCYERYVDV